MGQPNVPYDGRANRIVTNPDTLVSAPPNSSYVIVLLSLPEYRVLAEYDINRAKRLREDLDRSITLAQTTPYTRAKAKDETWHTH
jgi:hypothetical protein